MKKREWGALSFRVRKGTSLFFAGLLCFAMPAMAHAVEMSGEGQTEARPAKAVVENEPADDDALAIIVHPDNPVSRLTRQQLEGIFRGKIVNWK